MQGRIMVMLGGFATVALMLAALWGWQHATQVVSEWSRPGVAAWSVRCLALGLAAGAQLVCMSLVVGQLYRRDALADAIQMFAGLLCTLALVSALALGLAAGR